MNLKELKTELRINLDDLNFEAETDDILRLYINRGIRKVEKELLKAGVYLKKRALPLSFVAGTKEVLITGSDAIAKIVALEDEDGNLLDIKEEEFAKRSTAQCFYISRQITTDGVPSGSNTRADKLGYYMVPQTNIDVNLIVCEKFSEFPFGAITETLTDIPEDHHDCVVTWATIQALFKDEEPSEYWMSQWNDQINDLVMAVTMENRNEQSVVDIYGD